jgi:hypothetical protein
MGQKEGTSPFSTLAIAACVPLLVTIKILFHTTLTSEWNENLK